MNAGLQLMEALGLKPEDHVTAITIKVRAGKLPIIEIEKLAGKAEWEKMLRVIESYNLTPKE